MFDQGSLPGYIGRGGEQVYRPPFEAKGTRLFGFMLKAGLDDLDAMLDRYLNLPSHGAVDYRAASSFVMLYFASLDVTRSAEPPDSMIGWFNEHEVGFFTLAYDVKRNSLAVYMPYIFVEASQVMAGGREIYGFPKQLGAITMPGPDEVPGRLELRALAARRFQPDTQLRRQEILRVEAGGATVSRHELGDARDAAQAIFGEPSLRSIAVPSRVWPRGTSPQRISTSMASNRPRLRIEQVSPGDRPTGAANVNDTITAAGVVGAAPEGLDLVDEVLEGRVPMVFLKQFRDVEHPSRACYQAITEFSNEASSYTSAALLDGDFTVEIADLDSHPIVHELGFPGGPVPVELAFELRFDFVIPTGRTLWRAGGQGSP